MKKLFVFIILSVVSIPGAIAQTLNAATPNSDIIYYRFIKAPSSNLHLDASLGNDLLLNHYNGNNIKFGSNGSWMIVTNQGKVGIGTNSVSVSGTGVNQLVIGDGSSSKGLVVNAGATNDGILAFASSSVLRARFIYNNSTNTLNFWSAANGYLMTINEIGQMGIGTTSMGSHRLVVDGSIGAREIKVEATGWSDFVFEPDYDLKSLDQVEEFINDNGHLPDIPSAKEVQENGISLGEMDAKLMQKIEELTLYVFELKKENEIQTKEINHLKNKLHTK